MSMNTTRFDTVAYHCDRLGMKPSIAELIAGSRPGAPAARYWNGNGNFRALYVPRISRSLAFKIARRLRTPEAVQEVENHLQYQYWGVQCHRVVERANTVLGTDLVVVGDDTRGNIRRRSDTVLATDGKHYVSYHAIKSITDPGKFYPPTEPRALRVTVERGRVQFGGYIGPLCEVVLSNEYISLVDAVKCCSVKPPNESALTAMLNAVAGRNRSEGINVWMVPTASIATKAGRKKYDYATLAVSMVGVGCYHSSAPRLQHKNDAYGVHATIGFEWEVVLNNARQRLPLARAVTAATLHEGAGYVFAERDGSLGPNGVELVFAARSCAAHVKNLDQLETSAKKFRAGEAQHESLFDAVATRHRAGLHVHIGNILSDGREISDRAWQFFGALVLDVTSRNDMQVMAGRPRASTYCAYPDGSVALTTTSAGLSVRVSAVDDRGGRYTALNRRPDTRELRSFAGTADLGAVKGTLEYAEAMIDYCMKLDESTPPLGASPKDKEAWSLMLSAKLTHHGVAHHIANSGGRWRNALALVIARAPDLLDTEDHVRRIKQRLEAEVAYGGAFITEDMMVAVATEVVGNRAYNQVGVNYVAMATAQERERHQQRGQAA